MAEDRAQQPPAAGPEDGDASNTENAERSDRRDFLVKTARRAAYIAPVVLFFKPREAMATSGGSAITPG